MIGFPVGQRVLKVKCPPSCGSMDCAAINAGEIGTVLRSDEIRTTVKWTDGHDHWWVYNHGLRLYSPAPLYTEFLERGGDSRGGA